MKMKAVLPAISLVLVIAIGASSWAPKAEAHLPDQSKSETAAGIEYSVGQILADQKTDDDEAASRIFELGHEAVPALVAALQDGKNMTRAARSLAYVGGPEERKILLTAIKGEKDGDQRSGLSVFLAGALVQPASKQEWSFLEACIQGNNKKKDRDPVVSFSAALALGANGSQLALQLLEKGEAAGTFANTDDDSVKEIATAIHWIKHKPASKGPTSPGIGSDSDQIAKTVLANAFYAEGEPNRTSIQKTVFTKDKMRALASVEIYHGPKNAQGYDIVLQKSAGAWEIVGIWLTWVA
jgi:hypothetical protein